MRKICFLTAMLFVASLLTACGPTASNNTTNKPANAANNAAPKPAADAAAIETEVKKLMADMATGLSKNDADAFDKATADNYMFVGPNGSVATKAQRLASMKSGDTKYDSVAYDEIGVRSNSEGTGAISISRVTVKGVNMGQKVDGQFRATHVWRKTDTGWKLVHGQTTAIAAGTSSPASNAATSNANSAANSSSNTAK